MQAIYHYTNNTPDSKVHVAHIGPTWVLSAPCGPMLAPWTLFQGLLLDEGSHKRTHIDTHIKLHTHACWGRNIIRMLLHWWTWCSADPSCMEDIVTICYTWYLIVLFVNSNKTQRRLCDIIKLVRLVTNMYTKNSLSIKCDNRKSSPIFQDWFIYHWHLTTPWNMHRLIPLS